jgi:transcriptional antiterminator NusG
MGGDRRPVLLNKTDIRRILKDDTLEDHIESKKQKFKIGDRVKVTEGPFNTFNGVVSEINGDKVVIEIKIFGRNSNVELTTSQVENTYE